MNLIDDQIGYRANHIILNGNGTYPDFLILKRICSEYNGRDKIIIFPRTPKKRLSGLSALRNIHFFLERGFRNFYFIADREHITDDANIEIKNNLIGINVSDELPLQDAFLLICNRGPIRFNLYCSISGLTNCIEEELKKLIELQLPIQINVPSVQKDKIWRAQLKAEIKRHVNKKKLKKLLKESGRRKLESAFPNICAVFREIERNNDF